MERRLWVKHTSLDGAGAPLSPPSSRFMNRHPAFLKEEITRCVVLSGRLSLLGKFVENERAACDPVLERSAARGGVARREHRGYD